MPLLQSTNALGFQIKPNRKSFPAVTFCNMNPYKRSALISMPEVARFIESYNKASKTESTPKTAGKPSESTSGKKRRKRSSPAVESCPYGCTNMGGYNIYTAADYIYTAWHAFNVSWECGHTCCNYIGLSYWGLPGRLARVDSSALINQLISSYVIDGTPSWIAMYGTGGNAYWYTDADTNSGYAVNTTSCLYSPSSVGSHVAGWSWPLGGGITVKTSPFVPGLYTVQFGAWPPDATRPMICECKDSSSLIYAFVPLTECLISVTYTYPRLQLELLRIDILQ